jgi:hypothetical protein
MTCLLFTRWGIVEKFDKNFVLYKLIDVINRVINSMDRVFLEKLTVAQLITKFAPCV